MKKTLPALIITVLLLISITEFFLINSLRNSRNQYLNSSKTFENKLSDIVSRYVEIDNLSKKIKDYNYTNNKLPDEKRVLGRPGLMGGWVLEDNQETKKAFELVIEAYNSIEKLSIWTEQERENVLNRRASEKRK